MGDGNVADAVEVCHEEGWDNGPEAELEKDSVDA